ncbi:hypothetical protein, partial [Streptomyces brasiliscabiei]|uniref:hypothetical protein n=1 Tax=Streptomyces brasiliscabiei TaxID=2736302 RepID=UPI0030150FAD
FIVACESSDPGNVELSLIALQDLIHNHWKTAKLRDTPFRDLLAALEAATRDKEMSDFDSTQRNVLRTAFQDLARCGIEYND